MPNTLNAGIEFLVGAALRRTKVSAPKKCNPGVGCEWGGGGGGAPLSGNITLRGTLRTGVDYKVSRETDNTLQGTLGTHLKKKYSCLEKTA